MSADIASLEKEIGHHFADKDLITTALTHSSTGGKANYERLEFLGDRVLGLVVAQLLFETFPKEPEGDLAKRLSALVQGAFLAKIATKINLGEHIAFSEGERAAGGAQNANILADVFESIIGALYLDSGLAPCDALIRRLWDGHLDEMTAPPSHPKTALQEWAQAQGLALPSYEITAQSGPDHAPSFEVTLTVEGQKPVVVEGRSRQDAEKFAARVMLNDLGFEV